MKRRDAIEAAKKSGDQIVAGGPEQMTARLHSEIAERREPAARACIKPENRPRAGRCNPAFSLASGGLPGVEFHTRWTVDMVLIIT